MLVAGVMVVGLVLAIFLALSSRDRAVLLSREKTITVGNLERSYIASVPRTITEDTRLFVGLHGLNDTPKRFAYYTGFHNAVRPTDIVVYPKALPATQEAGSGWNALFCCGSGELAHANDVEFLEQLIVDLGKEHSIEPGRIFMTGFSNGAFMALRFAAEKPRLLGGVAASAGTIGTEERRLRPSEPLPVLLMHGVRDGTVPYEGGLNSRGATTKWLSFADTALTWQDTNKDLAPVETRAYAGEGHVWHDWRIVNFWHRTPAGSLEQVHFFDSLSNRR